MNKGQSFNARFGITINTKEAARRFLNRVKTQVFCNISPDDDLEEMEKCIAFELGEENEESGEIAEYFGDDFYKCLHSLEVIYDVWKSKSRKEDLNWFENTINLVLAKNEIDLGIVWKHGQFVPSGAEELDSALVDQPLKWLRKKKYSSVLEPYEKGLDHYLHSLMKPELLSDVVTDIYEAMEALAKVVTERPSKDLSANKELLISKLGVSPVYGRMLTEYINYANEFRHAAVEGKPKPQRSRNEVESFIYLTGVFLRLAMQIDQ